MNKAILIGNLGRDPELRSTQGGTSVCSFSIATSRKYTTKDGEKKEETQWHNIVVWGKQGENCAQYLKKGRSVAIEGEIRNRSYDDKDGNKRYISEVVAERVEFLGGGNSGGAPSQDNAPVSDGSDGPSPADDDIPF